MLWALGLLPVLLWSAAAAARRQRRIRAQFADVTLFEHLVRPTPRSRRLTPTILYLTALLLLLVGMARPIAAIPLPVNRAAVVLAIDTSQSMMADDVKPSRLEAAKATARLFVRHVPPGLQVGLVSFSDVGTILVQPSTDRQPLEEALERLRPQQSTSVGSAVVEGLYILPGRREYLGERLRRLRAQASQDPQAALPPPPGGGQTTPPSAADLPPAAIVIFSDGVTNTGVDPNAPASLAAESRVRVHAVGMGQQGGAVMPYANQMVLVPFDPTSLQILAQRTGGDYLQAGDEERLRRIARQLGRAIGWERRRTEITAVIAGAAGLLMLTGAALSLLWFRRVP